MTMPTRVEAWTDEGYSGEGRKELTIVDDLLRNGTR